MPPEATGVNLTLPNLAITGATGALGGRVARRLADRGVAQRGEGWVTSYAAVATGEMDVVSPAVETITGRPAQDLESFLSANPALWEKLAG